MDENKKPLAEWTLGRGRRTGMNKNINYHVVNFEPEVVAVPVKCAVMDKEYMTHRAAHALAMAMLEKGLVNFCYKQSRGALVGLARAFVVSPGDAFRVYGPDAGLVLSDEHTPTHDLTHGCDSLTHGCDGEESGNADGETH